MPRPPSILASSRTPICRSSMRARNTPARSFTSSRKSTRPSAVKKNRILLPSKLHSDPHQLHLQPVLGDLLLADVKGLLLPAAVVAPRYGGRCRWRCAAPGAGACTTASSSTSWLPSRALGEFRALGGLHHHVVARSAPSAPGGQNSRFCMPLRKRTEITVVIGIPSFLKGNQCSRSLARVQGAQHMARAHVVLHIRRSSGWNSAVSACSCRRVKRCGTAPGPSRRSLPGLCRIAASSASARMLPRALQQGQQLLPLHAAVLQRRQMRRSAPAASLRARTRHSGSAAGLVLAGRLLRRRRSRSSTQRERMVGSSACERCRRRTRRRRRAAPPPRSSAARSDPARSAGRSR